MRIGLIAPPWIPVPPPAYGGTEVVIGNLARGLLALGHDVRLFTVGESTCPVPRQWLFSSPVEPMSADKGVNHAVRAARRAGWPLIISAKMREPAERAYFDEQVRPLLRPGDARPAEQPLAARLALLRNTVALLNPITWPEPFGLVMAEALACATPVLAFPNGAAPEIIDHGRTGYLCQGEEDMTAALADVHRIDRPDCRAAAERRFSVARMAADHERLYRAILARPGQLPCGLAEASAR